MSIAIFLWILSYFVKLFVWILLYFAKLFVWKIKYLYLCAYKINQLCIELVNKGAIAEMLAGLEYLHYLSPNLRHEQYYWVRQSKNSLAEIDYVLPIQSHVVPMEVKAGVQGGMKSLWEFMREKNLTHAIRCSLENFGSFDYTDIKSGNCIRHVTICPLYAISQMTSLMQN